MAYLKGWVPFELDDIKMDLVTTTSGGQVVIMFGALGSQMELYLSPDDARDLAANLVKNAEDAEIIREVKKSWKLSTPSRP